MKNIPRTLVVISSLCAGIADASLVTETWSGQVGTVSGLTNFVIGETISWQVIYEDSNNGQMRIFDDGANSRSDRGNGDDTLNSFFCLDASSNAQCASGYSALDGFVALHDSTSLVGHIRTRMLGSLAQAVSVYDYWGFNRDNRISRDVPWGELQQIDYWADDFHYSADNYPYRCTYDCPNTGDARFSLAYLNSQNQLDYASIGLTRVSYSTQFTVIPEPSSLLLALIPIGLLLHRGFRRTG